MDTTSQEGPKEPVTTAAEKTSKVGGDCKTKEGCMVAENIKTIPCLSMGYTEHSHMSHPKAFIQVKKRTKVAPPLRKQIIPKCVYTGHKE